LPYSSRVRPLTRRGNLSAYSTLPALASCFPPYTTQPPPPHSSHKLYVNFASSSSQITCCGLPVLTYSCWRDRLPSSAASAQGALNFAHIAHLSRSTTFSDTGLTRFLPSHNAFSRVAAPTAAANLSAYSTRPRQQASCSSGRTPPRPHPTEPPARLRHDDQSFPGPALTDNVCVTGSMVETLPGCAVAARNFASNRPHQQPPPFNDTGLNRFHFPIPIACEPTDAAPGNLSGYSSTELSTAAGPSAWRSHRWASERLFPQSPDFTTYDGNRQNDVRAGPVDKWTGLPAGLASSQ